MRQNRQKGRKVNTYEQINQLKNENFAKSVCIYYFFFVNLHEIRAGYGSKEMCIMQASDS